MTGTEGIQIYVACHKPTCVLDNRLLVPVQVGAALTDIRYDGMRQDNEGEHISEKNPQYCELTAQYWAWKNTDCEYYGFFHYRRYLSFAEIYPVEADGKMNNGKNRCPYMELDDIREDLTAYKLDEDWMEEQIRQYDLLTVLRERINTTVYRQYCQYHSQNYLDLVLEILKKKYPEYGAAADAYMNSKEIYYMNMYIMKKPLFFQYMSWLFDILTEFEEEYEAGGQSLEPRMMGYLAERLFGVFYLYQRTNGVKCAEAPYLKFYCTELELGKTPAENVRVFRLKPSRIQIKIDMRKLNRLFPAGSRRRILLRSIFLR